MRWVLYMSKDHSKLAAVLRAMAKVPETDPQFLNKKLNEGADAIIELAEERDAAVANVGRFYKRWDDCKEEIVRLQVALKKCDGGGCVNREHDWSPDCGRCYQCVARAALAQPKQEPECYNPGARAEELGR